MPAKKSISIHSPRAGRDDLPIPGRRLDKEFQSTRPVRGETRQIVIVISERKISIHSPRAGRDAFTTVDRVAKTAFQSTRPVRGETQKADQAFADLKKFQSTRPVRGETIP